jgi:hypothetical protein
LQCLYRLCRQETILQSQDDTGARTSSYGGPSLTFWVYTGSFVIIEPKSIVYAISDPLCQLDTMVEGYHKDHDCCLDADLHSNSTMLDL